MTKVRIKLSSADIDSLNSICTSIKDISSQAGIMIRGPIPLPTKKLKVTTRKSPCGSGSATFDRYEMRVHKRIIDIPANDRVLHAIMRTPIPRNINIKIDIQSFFCLGNSSFIFLI